MTFLDRTSGTKIFYEHVAAKSGKCTFVFMNSSGANAAVWQREIVPGLSARGYGTIVLDYRGQGRTDYDVSSRFTQAEIVDDARAVLDACNPNAVVLVGLSVGGLHAAMVSSDLPNCSGLVLVNTLRKAGPLTAWLGELESRLMAIGGAQLVHDCFRPVTVSTEELGRIRPNHLRSEPYQPFEPDHPRFRLAEGARNADWAFPWEDIECPVLVMTGLHDRLFRVQSDVDEIVASMQDVQTATFENEGHALHTENSGRFVIELDDFARAKVQPAT